MHGARRFPSIRLAPREDAVMLTDSLFTDASWLFFAIWSIVIATVSVAAFGHDLIPSRVPPESKTHVRDKIF
jgi:hypothetical protein